MRQVYQQTAQDLLDAMSDEALSSARTDSGIERRKRYRFLVVLVGFDRLTGLGRGAAVLFGLRFALSAFV